jgi:hypothetical protein
MREANEFLDQFPKIHVHALLADDTFGVKHPKVTIVRGLETLLAGLGDVVSDHISTHSAGNVADLTLAVRCRVVLINQLNPAVFFIVIVIAKVWKIGLWRE